MSILTPRDDRPSRFVFQRKFYDVIRYLVASPENSAGESPPSELRARFQNEWTKTPLVYRHGNVWSTYR